VKKTAASAAQLAKCILLHAYSRATAIVLSCARTNKNFIALITSWHYRIFGHKLRTD